MDFVGYSFPDGLEKSTVECPGGVSSKRPQRWLQELRAGALVRGPGGGLPPMGGHLSLCSAQQHFLLTETDHTSNLI